MEAIERADKTYKYDCIRGPFNNIVYTGLMSLALLIAIRHYDAPGWVKAFIQSADSMGRLITPIMLFIGLKLGMRTSKLAAQYMFMTGVVLVGVAMAPSLAVYAPAIILAYILFAQPPQLMLHIYSENYSKQERGSKVSTMFTLSLIVGVSCSIFLGKFLDIDILNHRYNFLFLALAAVVSGFFLLKIPSVPLTRKSSGNAWENISLVWKDRLFGYMILGYILLGVGNSMIIPIRIEYMADPQFDINASNLDITLINVIVQGISMIVSTKIWGRIFDKFHFITTRLLINGCFIASYVTFFMSKSLILMGLSMVVNGFAVAGGMIVWNLWVTKIARRERTPAYMSAHIACSGVKGIAAPHMAYALLAVTSPYVVGMTAAVLMGMSCMMFYFVRKHPRIL